MSYRAYLDTFEDKTGFIPRQFIGLTRENGLEGGYVKAEVALDRLKSYRGLERRHGTAPVHVIKKSQSINANHFDTNGTHSDDIDLLR